MSFDLDALAGMSHGDVSVVMRKAIEYSIWSFCASPCLMKVDFHVVVFFKCFWGLPRSCIRQVAIIVLLILALLLAAAVGPAPMGLTLAYSSPVPQLLVAILEISVTVVVFHRSWRPMLHRARQ